MSNFPTSYDDDSSLPRVDDNIIEAGGDAINATRSAIFSMQEEIGLGGKGSLSSIADRLSISIENDGYIKPSALLGIGLVALPITNSQISPTAGITESKLSLNYSTTSLYNYYAALSNSVDVLDQFLTVIGIRVEPHLNGTDDRHLLHHIDIDDSTVLVKTNPTDGLTAPGTSVVNRDTTNLETLLVDINNDLVTHEKSDGSEGVTATTGGTVPPSTFAHNASGIYVNTSNFSSIPQSNDDVQKIANYIDSSSLLLIGGRTQNLFSNGISRHSRSTPLLEDGYGSLLVEPTPVTAYFLNDPPGPTSSTPIDSIDNSDDIILFNPTADQLDGYIFDSHFAQVAPGDLVTINYGTGISYQFTIDSVKAIISGSSRTYAVRINGRNALGTNSAYAQINKSLFNRNKYNALANVRVPNGLGVYESMIVASPRGATTLGVNFNPSQLSRTHYKLYLCLLQNGDLSSILVLPGVDVTGNRGLTPGKYTLKSIVDATNNAFRSNGFNYRFIAFEHEGQFGIALADHYSNSAFSIIGGTVNSSGEYTSSSNAAFANNVCDGYNVIDPLGFGVLGTNVASPPPAVSYSTGTTASVRPTIVFTPLKRNFYYVNGVERDTLYSDPLNLTSDVDIYGDGYWPATILPSPATQILSNRVEVVYKVFDDVARSGLRSGKTIVVQPAFPVSDPRFNLRDYGRFSVKTVAYYNCGEEDGYANITVYDGVHGSGASPAPTSTNIPVHLYFTDDAVSFNAQNIADDEALGPFKRFFESYIDKTGHTFTHERARFIISGNIGNINIYNVAPKLRGFSADNYKEIRLLITSYDTSTGIFSGNLARWDGSTYSHEGPTTAGKKGEIVRFYDETNIDYIDFIFDLSSTVGSFTNETVDIQLFASLALNQESMLMSTCQMNDTTKKITHLQDRREYGNISEEHLSTSAKNYITSIARAIMKNRTISGFGNIEVDDTTVTLQGGTALIDGHIVQINNSVIDVPILREAIAPAFNTYSVVIDWLLCANKSGQLELIADTELGALSIDRIFYVKNPNISSPVEYAVRSSSLATLTSSLTDVTPLYRLHATVTGSGTSWTMDSITTDDVRVIVAKI